jgi:hypothetical protein
MLLKRLAILLIALLLDGCATPARVTSVESRWPFQKLNLTTPLGPAPVYFYRGSTPARLVVVVHTRPCATASDVLTTGGVIWEQFRDDAFLQLERPGTRAAEAEGGTLPCDARHRSDVTDGDWLRFDTRVIAAVREREQLEATPTIYLGVREGAITALLLAARDPHARAVVLLGPTWTDEAVKRAATAVTEPSSRLRVVMIQSGADSQPQVVATRRVFSLLETQRPTHLIELAALDEDFGLYAGQPQCFDLAAQIVGEQSHGADTGRRVVTCHPATEEPSPGVEITRVR